VKTLIIGDIHGCFVELQALLDKAALSSGDKIIALGDIVDRGPESPQVLDYFRSNTGAISLMGNHERKHIRSFHNEIQPALSQIITRSQLQDRYPEAVAYMEAMPRYIELPEAILVHGGLEPGVSLAQQRESVLCGTIGSELYIQTTYGHEWYQLYMGGKPVIVGHQDYSRKGQPFIYHDQIYGLDTSCVTGGQLTGMILPDFQLVSVPSRGNLWQRVQNAYQQQEAESHMPTEVIWTASDNEALLRILTYVRQENSRISLQLQAQPGFDSLTPRQQAKEYAAMVEESPVIALLHQARKGELTIELARRILRSPVVAESILRQLDFEDPT
jgi:hypothetical protein